MIKLGKPIEDITINKNNQQVSISELTIKEVEKYYKTSDCPMRLICVEKNPVDGEPKIYIIDKLEDSGKVLLDKIPKTQSECFLKLVRIIEFKPKTKKARLPIIL